MQNINQRMAKGIIWMVCARLMDRSIGIVSTLILARLLVPGDFGLVAMATAIGGILDLLGAFSFDLALIQKDQAERKHYDTVWTFNVIFGLCCGAGLIALAVPMASFYREARLTEVMYVLSLSYFINAFGNVGVVNFRKNLDFSSEFRFIFAKRVITFIATITAAWWLRSYWALLIGMTLGRIVGVILSYSMNNYRPSFTLSAAKELFHFSRWLLFNNFLYFLLHDGCTFIIGRLFGVTSLGIYSVAYEIASLPSTELVAPINRATFPGFSKMQTTQEKADAYLKVLGMIALIIFPVGIGMAAVAEPLVLTTLGDKWSASIQLIQILAIHGAISALRGNDGPVWMVMGKPRETTVLVAVFLLILFPALYVMVNRFGIIGAGYAYLLAHIPTQPYSMYITKNMLKFSWRQLLGVVWRPLIGAGIMFIAVQKIDPYSVHHLAIVRLGLEVLCGGVVYVFLTIFLWWINGRPDGAESWCLDGICTLWRKAVIPKNATAAHALGEGAAPPLYPKTLNS